MKYIAVLYGGDEVVAETAAGLIRQLKLDDYTNYENPMQYKENISKRVNNYTGVKMQYENDMQFIKELVRVGHILELREEEDSE